MVEKGRCKHGEFVLGEGCPQCIRERMATLDPAVEGEEFEGKMDGLVAMAEGPVAVSDLPIPGQKVPQFGPKDIDQATSVVKGNETMAAIKIRPDNDEAVISLYNEGLRLQGYAEKAVIEMAEDITKLTPDFAILSQLTKVIEEKRKEYTTPLNDYLKAINNAFKDFTAPFIQARSIFDVKVKAYHVKQAAIRAEQERINNLRMEAARAEQQLKGEITESVNLVDVQPEAPKHFRTDMGTTGMVDNWKVEVTDFALLPDEYKIPDQLRLNRVVKAGSRTIPGCRIWNDPSVRMTLKVGE